MDLKDDTGNSESTVAIVASSRKLRLSSFKNEDREDSVHLRPNEADVAMTSGFMRSYVRMYQAEAQLTGKSKMVELKKTILKDCELWITSAAIVSCAGISALFAHELHQSILTKGNDGEMHCNPLNCDLSKQWIYDNLPHVVFLDFDWAWDLNYLSSLGFVFFMSLSSFIGITCLVDFITMASNFNMVPPSYICLARKITFEAHQNEVETKWSTRLLRFFGLDYKARMFFQGLKFLLAGIICGICNEHGCIHCFLPGCVAFVFLNHIYNSDVNVFWGKSIPRIKDAVVQLENN